MDAKISFLPNLFYDIAGGEDYETLKAAGIQLGPIIIPLYQSWEKEDSKTATNSRWIADRVRLQFGLTFAAGPFGEFSF